MRIPANRADRLIAFWIDVSAYGLSARLPGNRNTLGRYAIQYVRSSSSSLGERGTRRSLAPLPRAIRIRILAESMSEICQWAASEIRIPQAYRVSCGRNEKRAARSFDPTTRRS